MPQRTAFILAAVITSFLLVIVGGVAARLTVTTPTATATEAGTASSTQATQPATLVVQPQASPTYAVSQDLAATIALNVAPGATLSRTPELVLFQNKVVYEVTLNLGSVYVDANSGQILYNGVVTVVPTIVVQSNPAQTNPAQISQEQAIQAATTYVGGGTVVEVAMDNEHGKLAYVIKFNNGSKVYVDAVTGQVVYAEVEQEQEQEGGDG